jgi:hypothetical protein
MMLKIEELLQLRHSFSARSRLMCLRKTKPSVADRAPIQRPDLVPQAD